MKCKKVHNKLIFFLEKDLPAEEMEQVRKHLISCTDCALFLEEMEKTLSILERDKIVDENPFFFTRVKTRLENQTIKSDQKHPVFVRLLQPVAFSILFVAGIYGGFKLGQPLKTELAGSSLSESQMVMYLNEMNAEPIETFLME